LNQRPHLSGTTIDGTAGTTTSKEANRFFSRRTAGALWNLKRFKKADEEMKPFQGRYKRSFYFLELHLTLYDPRFTAVNNAMLHLSSVAPQGMTQEDARS